MKHYTTIEQSKKLLELGLNPETADMWWLYITAQGQHIAMMYEEPDPHYLARMEGYGIKDAAIPCWSLGALLEVMPFFITIKEEGEPNEYYHFQLNRNGSVFRSKWRVSYHGLKTERGKVHTRRIHWEVGPKEESDTPIEAAYSMVVWLLENGYIEKEPKTSSE